MSNGSRAVRNLRSDTRSLLAASDAAFAANFNKFKGAIQTTKQASSLNRHQLAWRKEAMQLMKARKMAEVELDSHVNQMMADKRVSEAEGNLVSGFAASLRECEDDRMQLQQETRAYASEIQAVLRQARALLKAAKQEKQMTNQKFASEQKQSHSKARLAKRRSVGFALDGPAEKESPSSSAETPNDSLDSPFASFLSNLQMRVAVEQHTFGAQEHNLVAQLLLLQDKMDKFEQPVEEQTSPIQPAEQDQIQQEEAAAIESDAAPYEETMIPLDENGEAPFDDAAAAFITSPHRSSNAALSSTQQQQQQQQQLTAADLSPRRSSRRPTGAQSSLSNTARTGRNTLLPKQAFPPIPDPDISLMSLPAAELQRQHEGRAQQWQEYGDQFEREVERRYERNLFDLRESFESDTAALRVAIQLADQQSKWGPNQQMRFQAIQSSYKTQGQNHAQLIDRLKLEFAPEVRGMSSSSSSSSSSRDPLCLVARVELSIRSKSYANQRSSLQAAFLQHRTEFVDQCTQELLRMDRQALAEYQRIRAMMEQAATNSSLHAQLEVLRAEYNEKQRIERERKAAEQAERERELQAKEERESYLRSKARELLQLWREHTAAEEDTAREQAEEERLRKEEELARQKVEARPRIAHRSELFQLKQAQIKEKEDRKLQQEEERETRLDAIRALVAITAERDADRAKQATASSAAENQDQAALFAVHGYDMNTLMKDKRFRVQLALWNAGVHNTDYAKQVVMSTKPAVQPRPDMRSNLFPSSFRPIYQ